MGPADLGLPEKFETWRPGQIDAIMKLCASDARVSALRAPPGTGKSLIYMAVQRLLLPGRTLILTASRRLQRQLQSDFRCSVLMGQGNYPCNLLPELGRSGNCDVGPCHTGYNCAIKSTCDYYVALDKACISKALVMNYSLYAYMYMFGDIGKLGDFDTFVLDEAHLAGDMMLGAATIKMYDKDSEELDLFFPTTKRVADWARWAHVQHPIMIDRHERCEDPEEKKRLGRMVNKLQQLIGARDWVKGQGGYIASWDDLGMTIAPVWPRRFAGMLFRANKVIAVSATVDKKGMDYLGAPKDIEFVNVKGVSAPKQRPIKIHRYGPRVGFKMTDGDKAAAVRIIDRIIKKQGAKRGLIHTVSYRWAGDIYDRSIHRRHMVTHGRGQLNRVVDSFKTAEPPKVLVSPSIGVGLDFPYEAAEYQIISKIPFPPMGSEIIKCRREDDKQYYNYITALTLTQMAGRIVRAADDYGETFITDGNMVWLWQRTKGMFDPWFQSAVQIV